MNLVKLFVNEIPKANYCKRVQCQYMKMQK